ncbi:MAG TPA: hypothetical protein VH143_31380 [Kofleriaceae bacterium]|jgi:hypothetical protein|nr:hypothetical protein [Kofleriaceae bacterium]
MKWHVELTRERFAELAQHVEWAVLTQHARIVAMPARSVGRLPAARAIAVAATALVAMVIVRWKIPSLSAIAQAGELAFGFVLAVWFVVLLQRSRSPQRVVARIRPAVARTLAPFARQLPVQLDYELDVGRLEVTSDRRIRRVGALTAHTAIIAVDVCALFKHRLSRMPYRLIHRPPPELLELLRARDTDVVAIDGPPAGYADALPAARQL